MNKDTVITIVRTILVAIGGVFVSKGVIESGTVETIVGGIVTVVGGIWIAVAQKKALNTPVPPAK